MFGILLSALNAALAFLVRSILVKFVVYFALFFVTTEFIAVISSMLPTGDTLSRAFGTIGGDVWYFLNLFNLRAGLPLILSAWVTRFVIRRLPIIG